MSRKPCWVMAAIVGLGIALGIAVIAPAQPPINPPSVEPAANSAAPPGGGKFLAIPGLFSLSMSGVQREIGLTGDQKQQLKVISDSYAAAARRLGATLERLAPDEKQKQGKDFNEQAARARGTPSDGPKRSSARSSCGR